MGIKKPGNYTSPLAPTMGGSPQTALSARFPSASPGGQQVVRGNAKDPSADPSAGTAIPRAADLERNGARYRLRTEFPPVAAPNHPSSADTLGSTIVVQDNQRPTPDGNYAPGTNADFGSQVHISRDGEAAPGLR